MRQINQKKLINLEQIKKDELEKLESEFKKIFDNLKERKQTLQKEFMVLHEEETKTLTENILTQDQIIKDLNTNMKSLKNLSNELSYFSTFCLIFQRKDESFEGEEVCQRG